MLRVGRGLGPALRPLHLCDGSFGLRARLAAFLGELAAERGVPLLQLDDGRLQLAQLFAKLVAARDRRGGGHGDGRRCGGEQLRLGFPARVALQVELLLQLLSVALVLGDLLLEPLQPLAPDRLPAHQVGEERAERLHLGVGPVAARAQLVGGAGQLGLGLGAFRALRLQALAQLCGGRDGLQASPLVQSASDGIRFLEKRPRHRLVLRELGDLRARRLELPAQLALAKVLELTCALPRGWRGSGAGHGGTSLKTTLWRTSQPAASAW